MTVAPPAKAKKTLLFIDEATYKTHKAADDELFSVLKEIINISEASIGVDKISSYVELLNDVEKYLIEKYYLLYGGNFPAHTDKTKLFYSLSSTTPQKILQLNAKFQEVYNSMTYKPTITAAGVVSTLDKTKFNKHLDEAKRPLYEALCDFIEASNKLKEFESINGINLIRCNSNLRFEGVDVIINKHAFL